MFVICLQTVFYVCGSQRHKYTHKHQQPLCVHFEVKICGQLAPNVAPVAKTKMEPAAACCILTPDS